MIQGLLAGTSIESILGALSIGQWLTIGGTLISAEPEVVAAFAALHPILNILESVVKSGASATQIANAGQQSAVSWLAANGQAAIDIQDEMGN